MIAPMQYLDRWPLPLVQNSIVNELTLVCGQVLANPDQPASAIIAELLNMQAPNQYRSMEVERSLQGPAHRDDSLENPANRRENRCRETRHANVETCTTPRHK